MSSTTTSGRARRIPSTAASGVAASPTMDTPFISPSRAPRRSRMESESSTMKALVRVSCDRFSTPPVSAPPARRTIGGDRVGDEGPAARDPADRRDELRRGAFLRKIAGGARLERPHGVLGFLVHAEHEYPQPGFIGVHLLDELDAAPARHGQVEEQHVELELAHALQYFAAVLRFAHDGEIGRRREHLLQPFANDRMVVGDNDADHAACALPSRGICTAMLVPLPGSLSMRTSPPRR